MIVTICQEIGRARIIPPVVRIQTTRRHDLEIGRTWEMFGCEVETIYVGF